MNNDMARDESKTSLDCQIDEFQRELLGYIEDFGKEFQPNAASSLSDKDKTDLQKEDFFVSLITQIISQAKHDGPAILKRVREESKIEESRDQVYLKQLERRIDKVVSECKDIVRKHDA